MRPSALVSSVALAFASVSQADIFQYEDCDGNGSLLLTELDAQPFVDLSGLYLECADLSFADLFAADLPGAFLRFANLSGANLSSVDLSDAVLSGADLTGAYLTGANLSNADLSGADLFDANLSGANLSGADLSGVRSGGIVGSPFYLPTGWSLRSGYLIGPGANLSGADLSGADLTGANLTGANLSGADLTGATGPVGWTTEIADLITGSCCLSSGCTIISDRQCTEIGGTWTEGGSCDDCQPAADDCPADVDGDGTIGFSDVLVILNDWGVCP